MKLKVVWIGKNKSAELDRVCDKFIGRIQYFVPIEIIQLKDPRIADEKKRIEVEGQRIQSVINGSSFLIALDPSGKSHDSTSFSKLLDKHMREDPRDLVFVVGGYGGLSTPVRQRANKMLSLSKMTFSHDLSRLILLEQLYRALSIIRNLPYAR